MSLALNQWVPLMEQTIHSRFQLAKLPVVHTRKNYKEITNGIAYNLGCGKQWALSFKVTEFWQQAATVMSSCCKKFHLLIRLPLANMYSQHWVGLFLKNFLSLLEAGNMNLHDLLPSPPIIQDLPPSNFIINPNTTFRNISNMLNYIFNLDLKGKLLKR